MASVPTSVYNYEIFPLCVCSPSTLPLLHPKFCIFISPLPPHHPLIIQTRWVLGSPATLSQPHLYMFVLWVPVLCPHQSICVSPLVFIPHRHCLISHLRYLSSGSFLEPSFRFSRASWSSGVCFPLSHTDDSVKVYSS